jgi:hypothetical protein
VFVVDALDDDDLTSVGATHRGALRNKSAGPPEIRDVDSRARYFSPWKIIPHAELMRISEPPPRGNRSSPPAIDRLESF